MDEESNDLVFTAEQIELIGELGHNLRPIDAVARILGVDFGELEVDFIANKSKAANEYWSKRELRITILNKATLDAACQGSTPAIEKALEILKTLK